MADIDAIILRAQRGGDFGDRRKFTLETSRAFKKMRQFALSDPHLYILELVQAAVANGADYVDLSLEPDEMRLSYVGTGTGFSLERLSNIFEQLFSSQDDGQNADLRALAMGFNALYSIGFERVVLESGDGTATGSARLEIVGETVSVGIASQPIRGTFVVVSSAKRDQNRENDLVIERCISSHVPICVNGRMLFASSKEDIDKFPIPFGYERCVRVDEGDLFGTLGLNTLKARRDHQALGAWSASVVVQVPGLRRA